MARFKVGILGTGFGAKVQLPGFRAHPDFEVTAIASSTPGRAEALAEELGVPQGFDDWRELVAHDDIDLVSVASTTDLHAAQTIAALDAGKAVLCEKPMALNVSETRDMLVAARGSSHAAHIDFLWRHRGAEAEFHRLVSSGLLGRVLHVDWSIVWPGLPDWAVPMSWNWQARRGGGMLGNVGSHWLDHLLWCFGPVRDVSAALTTSETRRIWPDGSEGEVDVDDGFDLRLRFDSGATGALHFFAAGHHVRRSRLEAHGSEGTIVLDEDTGLQAARRGESLRPVEVPASDLGRVDGAPLGYYAPFAGVVDRLARRLRSERVPELATFEDGARVQAVMEAARLSAREKRTVPVEAVP